MKEKLTSSGPYTSFPSSALASRSRAELRRYSVICTPSSPGIEAAMWRGDKPRNLDGSRTSVLAPFSKRSFTAFASAALTAKKRRCDGTEATLGSAPRRSSSWIVSHLFCCLVTVQAPLSNITLKRFFWIIENKAHGESR